MGTAQERLLGLLREIRACNEARRWVRKYDLPTLEAYWTACPNPDWLSFVAGHLLTHGSPLTTYRKAQSAAIAAWLGCYIGDANAAQREVFLSLLPFASIEAALAARATEEKAP